MKAYFLIIYFLLYLTPLEAKTTMNAYQFYFKSLDGKDLNLADYKGKTLLIVNTASQCGLTPQYQELEDLYQKYKDKGLEIIAVPSNNFGKQEPGNATDIQEFIARNFKISFLVTEKNQVIGNNAHPFYKWAATHAGFLGTPKWNFHKYLIDKNGNFTAWYASTTKPSSKKINKKIEEIL